MGGISTIDETAACVFDLGDHKLLRVGARGEVHKGGFTNPILKPRVYFRPPDGGVQEFDFDVTAPANQSIQVTLPIYAIGDMVAPVWLRGVRVYANLDDQIGVEAQIVTLLS